MIDAESPARRASDPAPIKPFQSSVVSISTLSLAAQFYSLYKVIVIFVLRAKFDTLGPEDFINLLALFGTIYATLFVIWKRIFRPMNRPIAPGAVITGAANAAAAVKSLVNR